MANYLLVGKGGDHDFVRYLAARGEYGAVDIEAEVRRLRPAVRRASQRARTPLPQPTSSTALPRAQLRLLDQRPPANRRLTAGMIFT
jgi:hypothetical protein